MDEIFESQIRSAGDLAGVFEFDGETGYFYLYQTNNERGRSILDAIRILVGIPEFTSSDIAIKWARDEELVSFEIRDEAWAVFDCKNGLKFGGNYKIGTRATIPQYVLQSLKSP